MRTVTYAVICAAGMGTRLGLNMPKCLVKVHGRCVIDYILDLLVSVENIRIVVGFMEEEVIEHVVKIRKDVVFVRNPSFHMTSNSYSLWLGSRDLNVPFLSVDGDMLIGRTSFEDFIQSFDGNTPLIGVSQSKTEEAVFVNLDSQGRVTSFQRSPQTDFEWCGIAVLFNPLIRGDVQEAGYVYSQLESLLPLPSKSILCFEIDTPYDLDFANANFNAH